MIAWFAGQYQWPPSTVLGESMGDLRRLCWTAREAMREQKKRQEEAAARRGK